MSDHNLLICEARPTAQDCWNGIKINWNMSKLATTVRSPSIRLPWTLSTFRKRGKS